MVTLEKPAEGYVSPEINVFIVSVQRPLMGSNEQILPGDQVPIN